MASSKFAKFTQADYDAIYAKLVEDASFIKNDTAVASVKDLASAAITVVEE